MTFGARALIRLGALKHNLNVIRAACPNMRIMAVIKANAYGHGMLTVAESLDDVDAFAVARLPEAVQLRDSGISLPVVLLSGVQSEQELAAAIEHGFEIVVHCSEQLALLDSCEAGRVCVWLKFDTGMNRLGFDTADAKSLIGRLQSCPAVAELRLMSHFACADEPDGPATADQLHKFQHIVRNFDGAVSMANSPAALAGCLVDYAGSQWIRAGIALFGVSPYGGRNGADLGLQPVMQFEARLIAVKPLAKGGRVGYTGAYTAASDTTLGIIAAGYGDGYSRHFRSGTPVLLNGRTVPLIGKVSMDMIAVDLGRDAADSVGDIATLWGPDLPVEEVAPWADAIPYELVCGVMNRETSKFIE